VSRLWPRPEPEAARENDIRRLQAEGMPRAAAERKAAEDAHLRVVEAVRVKRDRAPDLPRAQTRGRSR
jgi:hypothetical protein